MNQLFDLVSALIAAVCQVVLLPLLAVVEIFFALVVVIKFTNRAQLKVQHFFRQQSQLVVAGTRRSVTVIRSALPTYHH